jgi:hypothetical protein
MRQQTAGLSQIKCRRDALAYGANLFVCFNSMPLTSFKEIYILGLTRSGKPFRPSDWAERLAGVMSQFRPGGPQPGSHLGYSPWCIPTSIGNVKCVIVHSDLREYEVMAWDFCLNFAKDNELQVSEVRPEPPVATPKS